jgi:hypothetical protein
MTGGGEALAPAGPLIAKPRIADAPAMRVDSHFE